MASRIFSPSVLHGFRTPFFAASLGISSGLLLLLASPLHNSPSRYAYRLSSNSGSSSPKDWSFSQYQNDASVPVVNKKGGLNARAVRQLSSGSIIGLVAGLGVSMFSKSLTFLIGAVIVGLQTAESYLGIHIIPYKRLQNIFKSVDVRSAVQDNIAFKISFGAMFALSAFAEF